MNNKKKELLENTDYIKVVLMLLVLIYHCLALWLKEGWFNQRPVHNSQILSFFGSLLGNLHIYGFVIVSGYIFAYLKFEKYKYKTYKDLIINKAKRLIVPYIFVSIVWNTPFYLLFYKPSIINYIQNYFLGANPNQLWFLLMLFNVFIIAYLLCWKISNNKYTSFTLLILLFLIGSFLGKIIPDYFQILNSFRFLLFFYIGMEYRKNEHKINSIMEKIPRIFGYVFVIVLIIVFVCYYKLQNTNDLLISQKILKYFLRFIFNIFGSITLINLLNIIALKFKYKDCKIYVFLKQYNFSIYLFHQQIIWLLIEFFNGKISNLLLVLLNFICSFVIASIISVLLAKFKVTKKLIGVK